MHKRYIDIKLFVLILLITACSLEGNNVTGLSGNPPPTLKYTVSFDANGASGTPPSTQTITAGSSIVLPNEGSLSKSGTTFGGWTTEQSSNSSSYSPGSSFTPQGNTTLYAFWNASFVTYTVTFDANGGSGTSPASQKVQAGSSIKIPNGNSLSMIGFTFSGWATNANGTGTTYAIGVSFTPTNNITLYAIWVPTGTSYTVSFSANEGSGTVPSPQTVPAGSSIILPSGVSLSKSGATFNGWNTNANGTGEHYGVGSSYFLSGSITLYAQWTVTYTVTYNANGGSGTSPTAQTVQAGSSITLPNGSGISRSGFTFDGWNTNAGGTGINYAAGSSFTPTSNITLYAKWNSNIVNYTVTFSANGGSGTPPAAQTVQAGSSLTLPNGSSISRSGFTFDGWNTSSAGSGTNYQPGESFTPSSSITLYAKWNTNIVNYIVTFNANGGSGTPPAAQTVQAGSSVTLPSGGSISRSGFTFDGWNTNTGGTGTNYAVGSSFVPTSSITLYAKWNANIITYTVTYSANGGSGTPPATQTVQAGSSITLPSGGSISRSGFTFDGWNTNTGGTGTNYAAGSSFVPTSSITLYAKWNANIITYTVTYSANGGSGTPPATQTVQAGSSITLPSGGSISRSGFTFGGWNLNTGGTGTNYAAGSSFTPTSSIILYAKWNNYSSYQLGDTGPGGGKIFYRNDNGFTVYTSATDTVGMIAHYLEAAPTDMTTLLAWASRSYVGTNISNTSTAIGMGRKNTALILATDTAAPAAKACADYRGGGLSDWFLPSRDELNQLFINRSYVGNLTTISLVPYFMYLSSTQGDYPSSVWFQSFVDGINRGEMGKSEPLPVRAIRAF